MLTDEQFTDFLQRFFSAWPQTGAWVNSQDSPKGVLSAWRTTLSVVEVSELNEVLLRSLQGLLELPAAYDRQNTAVVLRRECLKLRSERASASESERVRMQATRRGRYQPLSRVFVEIIRLGAALRDGRITEEQYREDHAKQLRIASSDPNAPEPRYRCAICRDVGSVTIWHPWTVNSVRDTGELPASRHIAACACSCAAGDRLAQPWPGSKKPAARYDEEKHLLVRSGSPTRDDIAALFEFATPKRHSEFDEWAGAPLA